MVAKSVQGLHKSDDALHGKARQGIQARQPVPSAVSRLRIGNWTLNSPGVMHEGLVTLPASFYLCGALRGGKKKQAHTSTISYLELACAQISLSGQAEPAIEVELGDHAPQAAVLSHAARLSMQDAASCFLGLI